MKKKISSIIVFWALMSMAFFTTYHNLVLAQSINENQNLFLQGSIDNNRIMTGIYSKNRIDFRNRSWLVFIGANEQVYKITLIEKSIHELFIDGKKIEDSQIWKHTAEFKPFLEKFWQDAELENESRDIDSKIQTIERKILAVEKEVEKIEKREDKLDDNSSSFSDNQKIIDAERKKLLTIQKTLEKQLQSLANRQEILSQEQENLNLLGETEKILRQISLDLQSVGVIKSTKNISFKFSNSELIVNGKKISSEVHDLLKAKYIVNQIGEYGFLLRWKGNV